MRMRPRAGLAWLLVLALFYAGGVSDESSTRPNDVALRRELEPLVARLGADDFAARRQAAERIVEFGESALGLLRELGTTHRDYEIRLQTRRLVRQILDGLKTSPSTGMKFVVIDAGNFLMGSPPSEGNRRDDESPHEVRVSRPFLLGRHEVTQREFERVMGFLPASFSSQGALKAALTETDTSRWPVESVTWFDALEFCNRLSGADGYAPYYELTNVRRDGATIKAADVKNLGGAGYRLPTEAEWEYACRAGTTSPFNFGVQATGREGNFKPGSSIGYGSPPTWAANDRPTPVDKYPPAGWGLHDMHGNVAEWCGDWYGKDYYRRSPAVDPTGPPTGTQRVARGGSWLVMEGSCRSAVRLMFGPDSTNNYLGFRVARSP